MPKPCELKEINGAIWARLDIDWDGGPLSLYTEIEIQKIKERERQEIIFAIKNMDRITIKQDD